MIQINNFINYFNSDTAMDAISTNRIDVQNAIENGPYDAGVVRSNIPGKIFENLVASGSIEVREYSGFYGSNLTTWEVLLRDKKAIETFNAFIEQ